jgi:hypothetical protein
MKIKRKPLLYDELLASIGPDFAGPPDAKPNLNTVMSRVKQAKVFKFDDEAACYAARMMVNHPEAIAHDVEFAIPPFERMWIEFPYPAFYDITSPPEYRGYSNIPPEEDDLDVGYFFDGPRVYVASRTSRKAKYAHPMIMPIRYRLNQQYTYEEEMQMTSLLQTSRLGIDAFMWGSCYKTLLERVDKPSMRALRNNHSSEFWYGLDLSKDAMGYVLKTSAGDLRNIVGFILFLNRTRDVQIIDEIKPAPGFVRAKPRTLVRHSVIKLKLDPGPMLKRIFKSRATGGWRREHDVRGHWCHDRVWHANQHEHDLREIHVNFWKCVQCGGCKWWRKEHHRGRKDFGQVKTNYEVHA